MQPRVILASQSPQRRVLLESLGITFEVIPADIDEKAVVGATQPERARLIALAKAQKIQKQHPDSIIIAGDTFVVLGDQALEKPGSLAEAKQMLSQMSGRTMQALSGVAYLDEPHNLAVSQVVTTEFTFRSLSEREIDHYVEHNPVLTWSAGFSPAYPAGMALVAATTGSLTSFTHGLPLEIVAENLTRSGVQF